MAVVVRGKLKYTSFSLCQVCEGTGQVTPGGEPYDEGGPGEPITCPSCEGEGDLADSGLVTRIHGPENVFESYEVLECIVTSEYNELSDSAKEGINILLSCGLIDLNDGKAGKTRLWNWFDTETTTRANLEVLLSE